ncbi:hypothetical protein [Pseudoxanthomonas suwonensis]|uniref:hypothetical protein n=1 Tax=Pseudoxanthomonas suwonensis TaxID=314722 RepID=UPI001184B34D|nr:hypothetical protein [Pseudoxanthomonas suwonensis]
MNAKAENMGKVRSTPLLWSARILLLGSIFLALTACSKYEPPKPPDVEWNERPVDAYVATLKVEGLDEAYTVTANAYFSINNRRDCLPIDRRRSLGGSRHYHSERRDIPIVRVSPDSYKIVFYADWIKSGDYYGLGDCHWHGSPAFEIRRPSSQGIYAVAIFHEGEVAELNCLSHTVSTEDIRRTCAIMRPGDAPDSRKSFTVSTTFTKE